MFDDHLVVESPGNLPSQVKIETIRNAHFARNSHIAEYLKDYKYVKDFGEGVDRMCREMEAQGLPKPEYRQDAFILKAIVKNSGFGSKNLGIARLKSEILDAKLNASVRDKILQLVNEIQINQVFGAGDIVDILKCAPATATNLIKRMKTLNIVEPVVGAGKGKYVLRRAK
jgi:ATP-dependent DNA helicase RecG